MFRQSFAARSRVARGIAIASLVALGTLSVSRAASGQATVAKGATVIDGWTDTTHHKAGFIHVAKRVRLHYLDFGGTGAPIVMLAGLGNTAHAWDDFAPRFVDRFHVVALTRRGFGESSQSDEGYDTKLLVEDIRIALDRLHLTRVIFVGHSIAGEEMTRFAATYPDRVLKLVYLDAAYDRPAAEQLMEEVFPVPPDVPSPPEPTEADTATAAAYVSFVHRTRGVNIPESDIRTRFKYDGWDEGITDAAQSMRVERPAYTKVKAPALAIYAVTDSISQLEPWQRTDTAHFAGLLDMIRGTEIVYKQIRAEFRQEVAHSSVLEIHGAHHWIFVSNRDQCVAAIRRFLLVP
ncbi:MAG: alpha/beta hydrolase [Gemmatimonadaceae bacterium]